MDPLSEFISKAALKMLSTEFIPTSSSDDDFIRNNSASSTNNTLNTPATIGAPALVSTTVQPSNFTTNPEGIKFVPQPPVQFYYSLQKNSLRTVLDTLLTTAELGHICTIFKVPCYGKWLKKKMAAEMLVDHLLALKQAYQKESFNEIVEKINLLKGKEMLGKIPRLPEKVDALKVLKGSLELMNKILRPSFPVRMSSPLKEVTGLIFLDEVGENLKNSFTMDLYFAIPSELANQRIILCIHQTAEKIHPQTLNNTVIVSTVSPTLLDLTLNGSSLEQGNCRFRNHDSYDITLICYKDRANLLRVLRHETHVNLNHLVLEIVAINIAGSLSEARSNSVTGVKRPHDHNIDEDEDITSIRERYLKEDLLIKPISFGNSLNSLRKANNNHKNEELEILEDTMTVSLKCPISFTRINQPVKFKSCKHGQCFDLSSWKQLTQSILNLRISSRNSNNSSNSRGKKYLVKAACPVCGTSVEEGSKKEEIIIDGLFKKILESSEANDITAELNLKDGTFTFIKDLDDDYDFESEEEELLLHNPRSCKPTKTEGGIDIISLTDSDDDTASMLTYKADKSKPIGSCPSRAISID